MTCYSPLPIDSSHKYHNALDKYPTMHHVVTEMCTYVHISVTKWCILGYRTGALQDLRKRSIDQCGGIGMTVHSSITHLVSVHFYKKYSLNWLQIWQMNPLWHFIILITLCKISFLFSGFDLNVFFIFWAPTGDCILVMSCLKQWWPCFIVTYMLVGRYEVFFP